jgi:hypothetical protein
MTRDDSAELAAARARITELEALEAQRARASAVQGELKGISHPVTAWNVLGLRTSGDNGAPDEVAMRGAAG